jgi:uncharacterized protein YukE
MSDGYQVNIDTLDTHATIVDGLGTRVRAAGEKGAGADLGIETYGIIGQMFNGQVSESIAQTGRAVAEISTALGHTADGLRESAENYYMVEQDNVRIFRG